MGSVYLVYENNFDKPELLSVDYNFFNQAHPGDYVRVGKKNHQILQKIYDPQEMDLYINVSGYQEVNILEDFLQKREIGMKDVRTIWEKYNDNV